jgi:hypothetical protein
MCCLKGIPNSCEKWGIYSFFKGLLLDVCMWSWTYDGDPHFTWCCDLTTTWLFDPQHFLFFFLCLLLLLKLIVMTFLAPLPPTLGLHLFVRLMFLGLHCIFKLATHTRCHLDHFHSLITSCVRLLPMNIGLFYSSLTNISLDVINKSCNFDLLVGLGMDCPMELVTSCSRNPSQTFVSLWHTLCILACYFFMANIPL